MTDGPDQERVLISVERTPYGEFEAKMPPLVHNSLAIHLHGRTTLDWHCDARPIVARPMRGDVTLIPEGRSGLLRVRGGPCEVLKIAVPDAALRAYAEGDEAKATGSLLERVAINDPLVEQVSLALLHAVETPGTVDTIYRDALSNALLAHLLRRHAEGAPQPNELRTSYQMSQPRAKRAIAFMEAELSRTIGLDDIAREVGLSTSHFAAQFRQTFGRSPARYLTWLRLDRAREMVEQGTLPVQVIAAKVGFASVSHFSQAFRAQFGATPSEVRTRVSRSMF